MSYLKNIPIRMLVFLATAMATACSSSLINEIKHPNGRLLSIADAISISVLMDVVHAPMKPRSFEFKPLAPGGVADPEHILETPGRLCQSGDLKKGSPPNCYIVLAADECKREACQTLTIDKSIQDDPEVNSAIQKAINNPCSQFIRLRAHRPRSIAHPDISMKGLFHSLEINSLLLRCEEQEPLRYQYEQRHGKIIINFKKSK